MISIGKLRVGDCIEHDKEPYLVTFSQHSKKARGGGVVKTKIKNLLNGSVVEKTFHGNDKIQEADISYFSANFLYKDNEKVNFLNNESYEEFFLNINVVENEILFLVEGKNYDIKAWNGQAISVILPKTVDLEVAMAEPGVKGDTASSPTKTITLENEMSIQAPLFIKKGDKVKIDTETKKYLSRL